MSGNDVHEPPIEDNRLGRGSAWAIVVGFLAVIALPGLLREVAGDSVVPAAWQVVAGSSGTASGRLRALETQVDDGAWTKPVRQAVQSALVALFREGNRKVVIGQNDTLFHRPGIRALTGRGPMLGPSHSVSKDPALADWEGPLPVIEDFAAQLRERGIQLVLVPVADKAESTDAARLRGRWASWVGDELPGRVLHPLIKRLASFPRIATRLMAAERAWLLRAAPEGKRRRSAHPDASELLKKVEGWGVTWARADLLEVGQSHLRTDSHPMPHSVQHIARTIAESEPLRGSSSRRRSPLRDSRVSTVTDRGDLIRSLDAPRAALPPELVQADRLTPAASDPSSPIVLLGDSNVNMYDDPSLPFHLPGAGLASWLAAQLGEPLHVIAINGGGATKVRQEFARLPDDVVRAKKVVVWVIAERDLFMDPAVAKENGVEWKRVVFNPEKSAARPAGEVEVEATLVEKAELTNPRQADYADCVFTSAVRVDKVLAGTAPEEPFHVVMWNFRAHAAQPASRLEPGQKLRLRLVPWDSKKELQSTNIDSLDPGIPSLWWAEEISPQ